MSPSLDPAWIDLSPADTMAPLSWFAKHGYYVVDRKIFRHKVYAMQEATRKRLKPHDVAWIFNDEVYDSMDWKRPSKIPLPELYRRRAWQLREQYDYLILLFSGGGDSTNVLHSFVLNDIHLDEVVTTWPRKQTAGKYTPKFDVSADNFISEWDFLIEPKLNWLKSVAPKTKITLLETMHAFQSEDQLLDAVTVTGRHAMANVVRCHAVDQRALAVQKKHKNYAMIIGVDNPRLIRLGRHLLLHFNDNLAGFYSNDYTPQGLCRNVEFFYWTPDMPEMVREQAHALYDDLMSHPDRTDLIPEWQIRSDLTHLKRARAVSAVDDRRRQENMRQWMKSVLYPSVNHRELQVDKPEDSIHTPEAFSWFYHHPHAQEILQPHLSQIKSQHNLIDPSFFRTDKNNSVVDYHAYIEKTYHIGDLPA